MATKVREIMNHEVFSVRPEEPTASVLESILALGITGAPVLDPNGQPLGVVSLRDLVGPRPGTTAGERMTSPAVTIMAEARIEEAGRLLSETGYHRLVAVDETGRAVGIVSGLDVVRGLLGIPAGHPAAFPHLDDETGLVWTDDLPLDTKRVTLAPDGPGLIVLIHGGAGVPERVVWAECSDRVRSRLSDMLSRPQPDLLGAWLDHGSLRFRTTTHPDPDRCRRALEVVHHQLAARPLPGPSPRSVQATTHREVGSR